MLMIQVNLPFLFNTLNLVASPGAGEPEQKEDFVQQLINVYGWLLQNNEADLTSLETEIGFRYNFRLFQARCHQGISINIDIRHRPVSIGVFVCARTDVALC